LQKKKNIKCNLKYQKTDFVYTQGNRLRAHFELDQLQYIIYKLKEHKTSRRAIATLWDPKSDTLEIEVPCHILHQFMIHDNKLIMICYMRSNDCFGALLYDIYSNLVEQDYIFTELKSTYPDLKLGKYEHFIGDAHIYQNDFKKANELIKNWK